MKKYSKPQLEITIFENESEIMNISGLKINLDKLIESDEKNKVSINF